MSGDRYARSVHRGARRRRGGRQRSRPLAIVFAGLRTRYVVLSRTSLSFRLPSAFPVSLALVSGKRVQRVFPGDHPRAPMYVTRTYVF